MRTTINRRTFVRMSGGTLVFGVAALLEACSSPQAAPTAAPAAGPTTAPAPTPPTAAATAPPKPTVVSAAATQPAAAAGQTTPSVPGLVGTPKGLQLPTRVPISGPAPDLPGSADGLIDPGYVNYPANPFKSVQETPGSGGDVTVATWTLLPPPTAMESNALWQEANKQLGVTLRMNITPLADYQTTKLATIIASNDLPDILYIAPGTVVAGLPEFLKAKCADLTPYLAGDAVKDYPNLANFPTLAWEGGVIFNKAIYGVPAPYPLFLWVHWAHQEWLDQDNLQLPANLEDYKSLLKHFTNPQQDRYGLAMESNVAYGVTNGFWPAMFGMPNNWQLDSNGKLTYLIELDGFKDVVNTAREQWAAGVYSPNSPQYNIGQARNDFAGDKFAFDFDGFIGASRTFFGNAPNLTPPGKFRFVPPFSAVANAKPTYWSQQGIFGFSVLKQASPDRIKELLRVLNWIAAPFGSQEYLLMNYGVPDVDYKLDGKSNPVLTDQGKSDSTIPWMYITQGPAALYFPTAPEYAQVMQDGEKAMFPYAQIDPTSTLYSQTFATKGIQLNQLVYNGIGDVVLGRQPTSAVDDVVSQWKSQGGDQMRTEFEQAIADARS
ncbi:MAG: hypothetical protein JOZ87_31935 [Chloroflexi bacterium]|nr:hypothetical protein [Chloroflexota bacterium]